jgi:hypothetical protein
MDIDPILTQRWKEAQDEPSLQERYRQKLLMAFPGDIPSGELFYPNIFFTEDDEVDYLNCINIFKNKKWYEVDLDDLYKKYTQHLWCTKLGRFYYLPAFLSYFYNLRHLDLEYYMWFMYDLSEGIKAPKRQDLNAEVEYDYSVFECLTKEQARLVAVFLVNAENLYPSDYFESKRARLALKNYWWKFLLMDLSSEPQQPS